MSEDGSSRRLHGVLLADMTGFSRLMSADEARAFAALTRIRDVFTSVVPRHGGTLDVFVGDCFVALFDSSVEAVRAAIAIQTELAEASATAGDAVRIRIGVHMGDVVRAGSEIHGDSINVAARLQTIARPGGIAISDDVLRAVRNRITVPFRDLGMKSLKNIKEKMRVYEIDVAGTGGGATAPARALRPVALAAVGVLAVAGLAVLAHRLTARPALLNVPTVVGTAVDVAAAPAPTDAAPLVVGVTNVDVQGDVPAWMKDNTRDGLNTLLSKVRRLRVFSREKIDFLRERRGLTEIEVAETLGIQKMIVGSLAMDEGNVVLEARVVDIATGILDASETTRGSPGALVDLQNQLAAELLAALKVPLSADERTQLFAQRSNESLDGYKRLYDTFGEASPDDGGLPEDRKGGTSWFAPASAFAQDAPAAAEAAIKETVAAYGTALQSESVDAVAAVHVELTPEQREGFVRYFASADDLSVTLSDVDVLMDGDQALVTFTRRDVFKDHGSGKEIQLEVRLSSVVEQRDGRWLLRGVKRSS